MTRCGGRGRVRQGRRGGRKDGEGEEGWEEGG